MKKRREESKKIQDREVPSIFHHVVKGNNVESEDNDLRMKSTYAQVVKKGMEVTNI